MRAAADTTAEHDRFAIWIIALGIFVGTFLTLAI